MAENAIETIRLLVVSREPSVLRPLWAVAESNSWHLETAGSGWEALERIQSGAAPALLLLDLPRGDADSLHVLRWLRRVRPELPIVLLSHAEDVSREKEAMRLGAQEFLVRPFEEQKLEAAIRRHLSSVVEELTGFTSENIEQLSDDSFFVGASPVMQKLRAQAELLAQADVPVLIVGEPGSGRDTTARLIHKLSVRSGFRFLKVNCAALPGDLLDRELFGYGGSATRKSEPATPGKLELAERGTILLDEVVEIPMWLQEKLLHVMQEKQFQRSGTGEYFNVDVRILAAADINTDRILGEDRLREDFYYRLSAFTVHVPSLRQRRDEVRLLLQHFMHKLARHYGLPAREFSPAVLDACQRHSWPGNVRELESFVKRYLMIGDEELSLVDPGASLSGQNFTPVHSGVPGHKNGHSHYGEPNGGKSLKSLVRDVKTEAERNAIAAALEKTGWNRKAAARMLKVSYRTMLYKIEQYQMSASDPSAFPFVGGNSFKGNGIRSKETERQTERS
ncbi:MAG TPA: sigma-54 dependent transcriptional regulator [Terriglobales bacterium]|nr:sigma-54 dependent transcriptional regulator [Terriglobales bacterium]